VVQPLVEDTFGLTVLPTAYSVCTVPVETILSLSLVPSSLEKAVMMRLCEVQSHMLLAFQLIGRDKERSFEPLPSPDAAIGQIRLY
jgi:hypothetical protein